jgi:Cdc6-like AAA superfamily ATPase
MLTTVVALPMVSSINIEALIFGLIYSTDIEFNRTLDWLVTTDPSSNHNNACQLHEPHTGKWLTNSPEYASWKDCTTRLLWLHGIPGAGKTVLHSFIVEDVKRFSHNPSLSTTGWGYYYCYFARNQDETPLFLRWLINQLCRQIKGLPADVQQLCREGGHPSMSRLLQVLGSVSKLFSRVYVVIDALDESKDRERLLALLIEILEAESLDTVQLLVTSQRELDIERAILPLSTILSLSNPYVDEDIRKYIQSCLSQNRRFSKWPDDLKAETEKALVKGAKGM